jgi:hypothetical protein
MWKRLVIISTVVSAFSMTAALAHVGAEERDPFYPSADRPGVIAPRPSGAGESSWGRDPFNNPLAGKAIVQKGQPSPANRVLTGIIYSNDVRVAIFGGETYLEGSKVGDRKLAEIRMRSVVLIGAAGEKEEVFLEDFTMNK